MRANGSEDEWIEYGTAVRALRTLAVQLGGSEAAGMALIVSALAEMTKEFPEQTREYVLRQQIELLTNIWARFDARQFHEDR